MTERPEEQPQDESDLSMPRSPEPGAPAWGTPEPSPNPWGTPETAPPEPAPPGASSEPAAGSTLSSSSSTGRRGWAGRGAAGGAAGLGLLGKAGLLGKLALAAKALLLVGKFKLAFTMLITVGLYALAFGWPFAIGFVLLILVHELGHVVVARGQGRPVDLPVFVPFLGAYTRSGPTVGVAQEAWAALGGLISGLGAALVVQQLADLVDSPLLRALAYTGYFLTLINLVPALPLDGGRAAGALHPALWVVGLLAALFLVVTRGAVVLAFFVVLGVVEAVRRWRERAAGSVGDYYTVDASERAWIGGTYLALVGVSLWGLYATYAPAP